MQPTDGSSSETPEVATLIDTLKNVLSASDPAGPATREQLKETAEKLSLALETPPETVQRIAYYDLPGTIQQALPVPGMEAVAHDFFTAQPIKGARVYYLRNVLHDWPDDMCRLILSHLASAMTPGYSKILVNELVLPDQGCGIIAAQVDITMMACVAAEERSETQWHELVDSAGLKIGKIWTDVAEAKSVMELGLK